MAIAVLDNAEHEDTTNINLHTGSGTAAATLDLMFTTTNWSTAQTVTITAVNDTLAEAALDYIITHTVSGSGHTDFRAGDVDITVSANDPLTITIGAAASTFAATVAEGGSLTVSVVLSTAPAAGNVSVAITSNATDVTIPPASLIFSSTTYNTAQMVTLMYQNNDSGVSDITNITFTPSGGGNTTFEAAVLSLTSINDDIVGFVIAPPSINVPEGGSATFTIRLATEPSASSLFEFGEVREDKSIQVLFSGGSPIVNFTRSNWNIPQTVTITVNQDFIDNDPDTITIPLKQDSGASEYGHYSLDSPFTIVATRTDDDTRGLEIAPLFIPMDNEVRPMEGSSGAPYTVRLTSQPTDTVTVTIDNPDSTQITIDKSSLEFTNTNWDARQTVLVTAVDDNIQELALIHIIDHAASGGDYGSVTGTMRAVSLNNDTAGVDVEPSSITVTEGSTGTIEVMLGSEPTADVTVTFSTTGSAFTISSGATLTFTSSN